jgi:hypothetical protein
MSTGETNPPSEAKLVTLKICNSSPEPTEPTLNKRGEVSIWNADGPACPEIIRPAELSKKSARGEIIQIDRDSVENLKRQYLRRLERARSDTGVACDEFVRPR